MVDETRLGAGDEPATYEVYNAESALGKIRDLHTHRPMGWRGRIECPEASVLPCKTCAVLDRYDDSRKPCRGRNTNICVAEGCYGEACIRDGGAE